MHFGPPLKMSHLSSHLRAGSYWLVVFIWHMLHFWQWGWQMVYRYSIWGAAIGCCRHTAGPAVNTIPLYCNEGVLYLTWPIPMHILWYHLLHASQHIIAFFGSFGILQTQKISSTMACFKHIVHSQYTGCHSLMFLT